MRPEDYDHASIDLIEQWLDSLGVTLWADWDITRPDRKRLAAEWLYRQWFLVSLFYNDGRYVPKETSCA